MTGFRVKRVYDPVDRDNDGRRVLVDRVWPRGLRKQDAAIDEWLRDIAPGTELRRWFGHVPARWHDFVDHYHAELDGKPELVATLLEAGRRQTVTLCFGSRDREHNNAVALQHYLENRV